MGQVFVVSGVVLVVIAALFGLGVIPVAEPVRAMLSAVLGFSRRCWALPAPWKA